MNKVIKYIIYIIVVFVSYYLFLPSINLTDPKFWSYFYIMLFMFVLLNLFLSNKNVINIIIDNKTIKKRKFNFYILLFLLTIFLTSGLVNIIYSPLFMAKKYANRITVENGDFINDVKPVDFNKLALIDKNSSIKLGDKVMGEMTDLVSQFEVSEIYTQINYNDEILRVTPLEYDGFVKYLMNRNHGIPGFITVNSVSGETNLVRLENGMKITPSGLFFENLHRKLRYKYPFTIFGEVNFEVDDNNNPYWVVQCLKYNGIGIRREVDSVIILNPIDGTSKKYQVNEVPKWVDHVYSSKLIIEELNNWGLYKNGFINSKIGQKNVVKTSDGYNYLSINNNIYMYTGLTSVSNDESNIGFILTNLRTKETKLYNESGTIEKSAMESAKGQVQQMDYTATFPLLINLDNKPTYVLSLKDNAGLIKMYAFVDYKDYQKVIVSNSNLGIKTAAQNYLGKNIQEGNELAKTILIEEINTGVIDGNTYYYLKSKNKIYRCILKNNQQILPFIKINDEIKIIYNEGAINEIIKIVE